MKVVFAVLVVKFEIDAPDIESVCVDGVATPASSEDAEPPTQREGTGPRTLRGLGFPSEVRDGDR